MATPSQFAHVVYKTYRYRAMIEWYQCVFDARIQQRNERFAFLTYDDGHPRFAFLDMGPPAANAPAREQHREGAPHVAYTRKKLEELEETYRRLKLHGIAPVLATRHDTALSLYYEDPDGNALEFQVDLSDAAHDDFTAEAVLAGTPWDPDAVFAGLAGGASAEELLFTPCRPEGRCDAGRLTPLPERRATAADFLAAVDRILPAIRAEAAEAERIGRMTDGLIRVMTEAGVFCALKPRRWGGMEIDPAAFFEGTLRIGSASGSAGWVAGLLNIHAWHVGLFSEPAQREVFGDHADVRICSGYAPTGQVARADGGFQLSGRWGFACAADHCSWALLGGVAPGGPGGDEFRTFLVPEQDFQIDESSWNETGLRGSGSKDVVVRSAFVPEHRTHRLTDSYHGKDPGRAVNSSPLFKIPGRSLFACATAAPAVGAAVGALEAFVDEARTRFKVDSGGNAREASSALLTRLAAASTAVRDARARIGANCSDLYDMARSGRKIPFEVRARLRYEAAQSIEACLSAVLRLFEVEGTDTVTTGKLLLRDLMAMRNHPFGIPQARPDAYAKAILDLKARPFSRASLASVV